MNKNELIRQQAGLQNEEKVFEFADKDSLGEQSIADINESRKKLGLQLT